MLTRDKKCSTARGIHDVFYRGGGGGKIFEVTILNEGPKVLGQNTENIEGRNLPKSFKTLCIILSRRKNDENIWNGFSRVTFVTTFQRWRCGMGACPFSESENA